MLCVFKMCFLVASKERGKLDVTLQTPDPNISTAIIGTTEKEGQLKQIAKRFF